MHCDLACILLNWAKAFGHVLKTHCLKLASSFYFQPALSMRVEVLCPMLTNKLLIRGYNQLPYNLFINKVKKESCREEKKKAVILLAMMQ